MMFEIGKSFAESLDEKDDLAPFRRMFEISNPELIYANGNSLGRLPQGTSLRMREVVEHEWGSDLIRGWNKGWFDAPSRVGEKIAKLIGAHHGQTIVCDSTSVDLYKLIMAALSYKPDRQRVVSDDLNFPSDLYVIQGCLRFFSEKHHLHLVPSKDGITIEDDHLMEAIDERTALVTVSHVAFKSGFLYDIEKLTKRAHEIGALFLVDLSHSVGVVPIELDHWGVDLAVGCTYKYLNGGPGAPAFLYVRDSLQEDLLSPIWGWLGQQAPFDFDLDYQPAGGIKRFLVGTPPILSLLALEPSLDIILEAGIERIRNKSIQLTSYLAWLVENELVPLGFHLGSPFDPAKRGSHVSLRHLDGYRINRALIEEMSVIPDFREPDNIRLGLAPLYTSFLDIWEVVTRIKLVIEEKRHLHFSKERSGVT